MLSAYEQRVLTSIEQHFLAEDPGLYARLQRGPRSRDRRRFVLGSCAAGLGLLMIVMGVTLLNMTLLVFGCLVGCAGWLAIVLSWEPPKTGGATSPHAWGHWI